MILKTSLTSVGSVSGTGLGLFAELVELVETITLLTGRLESFDEMSALKSGSQTS